MDFFKPEYAILKDIVTSILWVLQGFKLSEPVEGHREEQMVQAASLKLVEIGTYDLTRIVLLSGPL